MHKPFSVTFDRDIVVGKRPKKVETRRFTIYISARNLANALRRTLKRFPGCGLVPNG